MQVVLEISGGGMRVDGGSWGNVEFVSKFVGRVDREGHWSTHSRSAKIGEARSETGTAIASLSFCSAVNNVKSPIVPLFARVCAEQ